MLGYVHYIHVDSLARLMLHILAFDMFRDVLVLLFPGILYTSYYPFVQLALHSQLGKIHMGGLFFCKSKSIFFKFHSHMIIHVPVSLVGSPGWYYVLGTNIMPTQIATNQGKIQSKKGNYVCICVTLL